MFWRIILKVTIIFKMKLLEFTELFQIKALSVKYNNIY